MWGGQPVFSVRCKFAFNGEKLSRAEIEAINESVESLCEILSNEGEFDVSKIIPYTWTLGSLIVLMSAPQEALDRLLQLLAESGAGGWSCLVQ